MNLSTPAKNPARIRGHRTGVGETWSMLQLLRSYCHQQHTRWCVYNGSNMCWCAAKKLLTHSLQQTNIIWNTASTAKQMDGRIVRIVRNSTGHDEQTEALWLLFFLFLDVIVTVTFSKLLQMIVHGHVTSLLGHNALYCGSNSILIAFWILDSIIAIWCEITICPMCPLANVSVLRDFLAVQKKNRSLLPTNYLMLTRLQPLLSGWFLDVCLFFVCARFS